MKKRDIVEVEGSTLTHKKLGLCEVLKVIDYKEGTLSCKVLETGLTKTLIFDSKYFENVSDFQTVKLNIVNKPSKNKVHKEVNYKKYRDHPFVKEIDRREAGIKFVLKGEEDNDDTDDMVSAG